MATTINSDLLDALITTFIDSYDGLELTLHTADPGADPSQDLTTAVDPYAIALEDWTAFAEHTGTGGRKVDNDAALELGNAVAEEEITHFCLTDLETGYAACAPLAVPQTTSIGNPVRFPLGNLVVYTVGAS